MLYSGSEQRSKIIYSIISGSADIDSLTGCVTDISGNYTIRATATGLTGCGVNYTNRQVHVTTIAEPVMPADKYIVVDTPGIVAIIFDTIRAGSGGDAIEWAYNENFTGSAIITSPAVISISLQVGTDTAIWVRSYYTDKSKHSRAHKLLGGAQFPTISAALLDKSKWQLNWFDEFNYTTDPNLSAFQSTKKWALNYCFGGTNDDCSPSFCVNHTTWGNADEVQIYNAGAYSDNTYTNISSVGNGTNGSGGEVSFSGAGIAHLTATPITPIIPDCVSSNCCTSNSRTFSYKSGMLASKRTFDFSQPGMYELRCKYPPEDGSWPAFWFFGNDGYPNYYTTEIDVFDHINWDYAYGNDQTVTWGWHNKRTPANIIDWSRHYTGSDNKDHVVSCTGMTYKHTDCDFTQDWHTYTLINANSTQFSGGREIIFFIDGKETWSQIIQNSPNDLPRGKNFQGRLLINLGNPGDTFSSADYQLDYFRYYEPKTAYTTAPAYLQNIYSGVAKTLEFPNFYQTLFSNYVRVSNHSYQPTASIANSHSLGTLGTGSNLKVFYKGANAHSPVYYLYQQSNNWIEQPINACYFSYDPFGIPNPTVIHLNDAKDFITPTYNTTYQIPLVYFQSNNDELHYYSQNSSSPTGWWEIKAAKNNNHLLPVNNCAGNIVVDIHGKTFYKGTDNNIWCWTIGSGSWWSATNGSSPGSVNNNGMVAGSFVVASCGCLAFYRDAQNNLRQLYWWNGWNDLGVVVNSGKVTDNLAIDEQNSRIYFIDTDHRIWYYIYYFSTKNTPGLFRLGNHGIADAQNNSTLCSDYDNAASSLVLSTDKNMVFYKATDNNLWYFFNDKENSSYIDPITLNPNTISRENWNKTPLSYDFPSIQGQIAMEALNNGTLFYVGSNSKLYGAEWWNADNPVLCNTNVSDPSDETHNNFSSFKTDETANNPSNITDSLTAKQEPKLSVYPNPSKNTFTFETDKIQGNSLAIKVSDVNGRVVYKTKASLSKVVWNAGSLNGGVYYYEVSVDDNYPITGKLIKY